MKIRKFRRLDADQYSASQKYVTKQLGIVARYFAQLADLVSKANNPKVIDGAFRIANEIQKAMGAADSGAKMMYSAIKDRV